MIDPDALHVARQFARRELAGKLEAQLVAAYEQAQTGEPYSLDKAAVDRRRLKNHKEQRTEAS